MATMNRSLICTGPCLRRHEQRFETTGTHEIYIDQEPETLDDIWFELQRASITAIPNNTVITVEIFDPNQIFLTDGSIAKFGWIKNATGNWEATYWPIGTPAQAENVFFGNYNRTPFTKFPPGAKILYTIVFSTGIVDIRLISQGTRFKNIDR